MVKKIKSKERLIVALDVDNIDKAKRIVEELGDEVVFYKIGLELLMGGDYFNFINWLSQKNKRIFVDLKLLDISATVSKAIKNLTNYTNIDFLTIHFASKDIMEKANLAKDHIKILAVTILTNLDRIDLSDIGINNDISVSGEVVRRAKLSYQYGVDGVISSGLEADNIRKNTSDDFLIVTPAIRPDFLINNKSDDQKRIVTVQEAFNNGADYIVMGRPITQSDNPKEVAIKVQQQIQEFFN